MGRRIKKQKNPKYDLYKQFLFEKGRILKSDRILIIGANDMSGSQFKGISYRKLFVNTDTYGFYRMRNVDFENWIILKDRLNKLNRIKSNIK